MKTALVLAAGLAAFGLAACQPTEEPAVESPAMSVGDTAADTSTMAPADGAMTTPADPMAPTTPPTGAMPADGMTPDGAVNPNSPPPVTAPDPMSPPPQ